MRFLERSLVTNRIRDYAECVDTDPLPCKRFSGVLGIIRCSAFWGGRAQRLEEALSGTGFLCRAGRAQQFDTGVGERGFELPAP